MRVADLSPEVRELVGRYHIDHMVEKHESWTWSTSLDDSAFFTFENYEVLLPISEEDRNNVSLIWLSVGKDRNVLTIYLEDTTVWDAMQSERSSPRSAEEEEWMKPIYADYIAICEKVVGQECYIATFYHQGILNRTPGSGPRRA